MLNLTMYGSKSSSYEYLKSDLIRQADNAGVQIQIEEVMEAQRFVDDKIPSIPAVRKGSEVMAIGGKDIKEFAREVGKWILKEEDFGNMKKIIVPIDFSEASDNASRYAMDMAMHLGATVQLVHIYHPSVVTTDGSTYIDPEGEDRSKALLEEKASAINERFGQNGAQDVYVDQVFRVGFAADEILELANEAKDSIIVMGSTGSTGPLKKIFGSVSTKVAKNSESPVLIIPPEVKFQEINTLVYCAASSKEPAHSLEFVTEWARQFEANVDILHIFDSHSPSEQEILNFWGTFYPVEKLNVHIVDGLSKKESITQYCEENPADMIAMSTRNRNFFQDLFHDSLSKKMAIYTTKPLLIIHNPKNE